MLSPAAAAILENAECLQQCFKMFQIIRRMMNALTQAEVSQVLSPWGIRLLKPMLLHTLRPHCSGSWSMMLSSPSFTVLRRLWLHFDLHGRHTIDGA